MTAPQLELTPVRPAVRSDAPCSLDLLVTVRPPTLANAVRPPLNLGLVLDRSGSMGQAKKIGYAREAAGFAVRQLTAADRASLTVFDDAVETLVPNATVGYALTELLRKIAAVEPGGSTALHGGWLEGARQVRAGFMTGGLNRVVLLSDGLANVGMTEPDAIATDVHRLSKEGVGTSTLGLGDDYNEVLLEAMARAGDGNYYYVEDPAQLPAIFAAELAGLAATVGRDVSLSIDPGPGVTVADHLNDFDRLPDGRLKLPTLIAGMPVYGVVRLNLPAAAASLAVATVTLNWTADGTTHRTTAGVTLPAVSGATWHGLAAVVPVQERAAVLLVARHKRAATAASAAGDRSTARKWLAEARAVLAAAPATPELVRQAEALARMENLLHTGQHEKFRKRGRYEAYSDSHSRPLR